MGFPCARSAVDNTSNRDLRVRIARADLLVAGVEGELGAPLGHSLPLRLVGHVELGKGLEQGPEVRLPNLNGLAALTSWLIRPFIAAP